MDAYGIAYFLRFDNTITSLQWFNVANYGYVNTGQTNPSFTAIYAANDGYLYGSEANGGQIWSVKEWHYAIIARLTVDRRFTTSSPWTAVQMSNVRGFLDIHDCSTNGLAGHCCYWR